MEWHRKLSVLMLLALSVVGCQQDHTLPPNHEGERLVQELFAAWNEHDSERLDTVFTRDGVYEDVAAGDTYTGLAGIKGYLNSVFTWAPDFAVNLTSMAVAGQTVVVEWTMEGTQTGPMGAFPATGNRFSVRGASVIELEGERIRRNRDYYDGWAFLRQLGAELKLPDMGTEADTTRSGGTVR